MFIKSIKFRQQRSLGTWVCSKCAEYKEVIDMDASNQKKTVLPNSGNHFYIKWNEIIWIQIVIDFWLMQLTSNQWSYAEKKLQLLFPAFLQKFHRFLAARPCFAIPTIQAFISALLSILHYPIGTHGICQLWCTLSTLANITSESGPEKINFHQK